MTLLAPRSAGGSRSYAKVRSTLLGILAGTAVLAARAEELGAQQLDLFVRQGIDSNVFQVPATVDSVRVEAMYVRARARLPLEGALGDFSLRVRPGARVDWVPGNSRANAYGADLALRLRHTWRNSRRGVRVPRRIVTQAEASAGYDRAHLSQRQTRDEFHAGVPLDAVVSFAELPTRANRAADLGLRVVLTQGLELELGVQERRVEYRAPEGSSRAFHRLDRTERGASGRLSLALGSVLALDASARGRDMRYPNQEARTAEGAKVEDARRHYQQWGLAVGWGTELGRVTNRASAALDLRRDLHEEYYDYRERELADELRIRLTEHLELALRYAQGRRDYERYAPMGEPTRYLYRDATGTLGLLVARGAVLLLGADFERTVSNDPRLAYERLDGFVELRVAAR